MLPTTTILTDVQRKKFKNLKSFSTLNKARTIHRLLGLAVAMLTTIDRIVLAVKRSES